MTVTLERPGRGDLDEILRAVSGWQHDGGAVQLHAGDIGWHERSGAEATAAALRGWRRDGALLAIGLLDGPGLVRLAIAPEADDNDAFAHRIAEDLSRPERGVLPAGRASVETRAGAALWRVLVAGGWTEGEAWTPLTRDLTASVEDPGIRIGVIDRDGVGDRVAVQRASFAGSTFSAENWHAMAAGTAYADARCLVGYDEQGAPVAMATVWSAGVGRPGILEPVGVHRDHRHRGHGTAITVAAAAALREMGASSATVCTPATNEAAVATYASAGFERLPDARDLCRPE